jgi:hypothetical protein
VNSIPSNDEFLESTTVTMTSWHVPAGIRNQPERFAKYPAERWSVPRRQRFPEHQENDCRQHPSAGLQAIRQKSTIASISAFGRPFTAAWANKKRDTVVRIPFVFIVEL